MSGNLEMALLTRVIDDKDYNTLDKAQITEEFFGSPEAREIYRYLREVYRDPITNGQVPSRDAVRMRYPQFYPIEAPDTVAVLAQELRREKVRIDMLTLAQDIAQRAELNPMEAMATLRAEAARISALAEVGQDLSMSGAFNMLLDRYEAVQDSGGLLGIPTPWHVLNEETQGMQPGQFWVLFGRPKSMKTWVACYMAVHAYINSRKRVLLYTREMSPELMAMRTAALIARVDYRAYKNGKLQPELKHRMFTMLQELIEDEKSAGAMGIHQPCFTIVSDRNAGGQGGGGVGWLRSKIREMQPDLVVVDGMYLMKDDRTNQRSVDWKQIAHISQDLKLTAQEFNVPLLGVTQANRASDKSKGEDLTELAYADALGQDADAVMRVSRRDVIDPDTKQKRTELDLGFPGIREGKLDGIVIHGEPATNFGYIRNRVIAEEQNGDYQGGGGRSGAPANPTRTAQFRRGQLMDPRIPVTVTR